MTCSAPACRCISPCESHGRRGWDPYAERDSMTSAREDGADLELAERMTSNGYTYDGDGCWSKVIRVRKLTCRRTHRNGIVIKGDVYRETSERRVDAEGDQHTSRQNVIVRYAPGDPADTEGHKVPCHCNACYRAKMAVRP